MLIREDVPLAPLTTLGVGGPARYFVEAAAERDVHAAFDWAGARSLPVFVLGGGSNVVVSDEGFSGLVLRIALRGITERTAHGAALVTAGAGEDWDAFVGRCVSRGYAGVECLSGIPGFVGGTPVQNVGAYGQEVSETIRAVRAYDTARGFIVELDGRECGFAYRASIFNTTERGRYVVLSVVFALAPGGAPALRYADLRDYFAEKGIEPTLASVREAVLKIRSRKSMVISPADPNSRSVGSFFKNPVVGAADAEAVEERARREGLLREGERMPRYSAGAGMVKLVAAWLIERSGFFKGYTKGRVGLSSNHALAIVNRGGATAREVLALMREIQGVVRERFSVELRPEPVFVGFAGGGGTHDVPAARRREDIDA